MAESQAVLDADVVVIGAGPGGLEAALAAAQAGARVVVLDAAPMAGGQVWRARQGVPPREAARLLARLADVRVPVLAGTRVAMPLPGGELLVDGPDGGGRLRAGALVLATGARERLLPFPGWTLPGVFGAGGLQALVKGGWPIAGRRVVVAGTGPLLLAAAATLRREGAQVLALVEEAPAWRLARFGGALLRRPRKALQALGLGAELMGVPFHAGCRIAAAEGEDRLEGVTLVRSSDGRRETIACDALAAGWGLLPQVELAQALGCAVAPRFGADAVVVDAWQRTSVENVYAVGESTGVAGAAAAGLQGRIAGAAAAGRARDLDLAPLRRALAAEHRFATAVAATFAVPAGWGERLREDTLVCRCEDVRWSALRRCHDLREAKLATRCGMGHCQGRLCHDTLATVMSWPRLPARTPVLPVPLGTLLAIDAEPESDLKTLP
jgi:NADPH-dependent 2,4-dienoyl-CoA reductase/sulfur reductase-like enzyme